MRAARPSGAPWAWLTASVVGWHRAPQPAVDLGRCLPAWALQLAGAVTAVACVAAVASDGTHWLLAAGAIATVLVRPDSPAPTVLVVGVGLGALALDLEPFDLRVPGLILGLHLTHHVATVVGDLPWSGAVEAQVLVAGARPFLAIQAFVQVVALLGAAVAGQGASLPGLAVVAGVVLAALAWAVAARLSTPL